MAISAFSSSGDSKNRRACSRELVSLVLLREPALLRRYQSKGRIHNLRREIGPVGADIEKTISGRRIDHLVAGGFVDVGNVNDGDLEAMSVAGRHIRL